MLKIGLGLGIKPNSTIINAAYGASLLPETLAHIARVEADGGVIDSPALCNDYFAFKAANSFMSDVIIDAFPHVLGYKIGTTDYKCSKVYSTASDGSGDFVQANAANQPRLLQHSGEKYVHLPNINGGYISTAGKLGYSNYLQVEAKVDFIGINEIHPLENGVSGYSAIACQRSAADVGTFLLYYDTAGTCYMLYYDALLNRTIDVSTANLVGTEKYIRVTLQDNGANRETIFETSTDGTTWTQLGDVVTNVGNVDLNNDNSIDLTIGSSNEGVSSGILGNIYWVKIRQAVGVNSIVFDFEDYDASVSELAWGSSTGETWTITPTPSTAVHHATVVTRTLLQPIYEQTMLTGAISSSTNEITQVSLISIKAAPTSGGGNIYRGTLFQTRLWYYTNQLMFSGAENSDGIWGSYFDTPTPAIVHGVDILNNINQFVSYRVSLTTGAAEFYKNNAALCTAPRTSFAQIDGGVIGGYIGFTVAHNHGVSLALESKLSEAELFALHNFINDTLFDGEIY